MARVNAVARVAPDSPLASELIMRSLVSDASARRKETLQRLVEACNQIGGKKPIKLTDIEKYIVKAYGPTMGPRAQSISNEKKLPLGMYHYVEARNRERQAAGRGAPLRGQRVSTRTLTERVEAIADMDLRADMRDLVDRLAAIEQQLARAKTLFKTLPVGVDFDAVLEGRPIESSTDSSGSANIAPTAVAALKNLVAILADDATLARCGLALRDGRITRRSGTLDELIPADVLQGVIDLCDALAGREARLLAGGGP
jgi:hypothetical protein